MGGVNSIIPATCHPDRLHLARGLCGPCYQRQWRTSDIGRARKIANRSYRKTATPAKLAAAAIRTEAYRKANPGAYADWYFMKNYGITREQRDAMWEAQGRKCLICGKSTSRPVVDHDHEVEKLGIIWVRGLLCNRCNQGLGRFEFSDSVLTALIKYANIIIKTRAKYAKEDHS